MLQLSLLAQDDASGWMNILFIVVVAVFWAVGGLIKATSNKSRKQGAGQSPRQPSDGPKRESWLQQLVKKAEDLQRAIETEGAATGQRTPAKPQERPVKSPQRPQGRVAVRTGRGGKPVLVYERQTASRPTEAPTRSKPQPPEESPEPLVVLKERTKSSELIARPSAPASEPTALVIDYTDPDVLKKAILHYEILGKPMALRDPFERSSLT